jgi:uncharacterized protein YndB with AHSA1/START domain
MTRLAIAGLLATTVCAAPASADVLDAAPGGFSLRITADVRADRRAVFTALADKIGSWWDPAHTYSGNAGNLSLDARAGGCFCEKLPDGGSVQHMTIVWTDGAGMLRMTGGLGPLQGLAVAGSMTWTLTETNGTTAIALVYTVGGYSKTGLEPLAKPVDAVLAGQVQRLKRFIESGKP